MGLFGKIFGKGSDEELWKGTAMTGLEPQDDGLPGFTTAPPGKVATLRIAVDRGACVGSGDCIKLAPGVFSLDEEGMSVVVDASAADRQTLLLAAERCPSQAIKLWELDGTQVYPEDVSPG